MGIESLNRNQSHIDANRASDTPPSFNDQAQIKAFKRDLSFLQKIKNKVSTLLVCPNTTNKQLSDYAIKKISSIEQQQEEMDEYEPLTAYEADENKPFKLDSATKNNILKRLKDKGLTTVQAKNIFNTEFKTCKSYEEVDSTLIDIPSIAIYKMGFNSVTKMHKHLADKLEYLISLGYNKKQSKQAILASFNQSSTKKEFNDYLNSIPKYEDYNKGYSSPKEVQTIKQNAIKKLLKQGYSKHDAEDIIEEYYINTQSKDDFLSATKKIPKHAIWLKGYATTDDYAKLQNACIDKLKFHLGYSHKKATKTAIEYQQNAISRTAFLFKINSIHAPIK